MNDVDDSKDINFIDKEAKRYLIFMAGSFVLYFVIQIGLMTYDHFKIESLKDRIEILENKIKGGTNEQISKDSGYSINSNRNSINCSPSNDRQ